jgi:hypothetical protein
MTLRITPDMDLFQLSERVYVDGNPTSVPVLRRMRDLLIASGHEATDDIPDGEWFDLIDRAVLEA